VAGVLQTVRSIGDGFFYIYDSSMSSNICNW